MESFIVILLPANEVCEGYVFTGVCLSTGGVCAWLQGGVHGYGGVAWLQQGMHGGGGHAWLWGGMHGCGVGMRAWWQGGHAWDTTRYGQ